MAYKEDIEEAKERMSAWWEHEIIDRPVISYYIPRKRGALGGYLDAIGQDWTLAQNYDNIDIALDGFEKRTEKTMFCGEAIPSYFPNYGPGIVAAVFGVKPKFETETVWFSRPTEPENIIPLLESAKLNKNNEWYSRLVRVTEKAAERAKKNYQVSITDIGGVLDILSSFLGPTKMLLTMRRRPDIIDTCREIILEKLLKIFDELYKIIKQNCGGFNTWLNVWCPESWYPVQCDFIAMLNPKWFKRFVLPDLITQMDHMDYAMYHMDGPYQIPFLDDFLAIESLTGIQWVPGAGREPMGHENWYPLYKKIQKAGKNIVIDSLPENIPSIYNNLDHKGLYVRTYYMNESVANFHLPQFVGGDNGVLIQEAVDWAKSKGLDKIIGADLEAFAIERSLELNPKLKRELVKEINNKMRKKLFFT